MIITKLGHACLIVENDGQKIIIDPGSMTELPPNLSGFEAIIVTHIHFDHFDHKNITRIIKDSPQAEIYGPPDVIDDCQELKAKKLVAIDQNQPTKIAGLGIDFYYVDHATIYQSAPCKNLAVKIADELYYPGDSLHVIDDPVRVAAVPISGPWVKTSEYIDFALKTKARLVFPIHNGLLNETGQQIMSRLLAQTVEQAGMSFRLVKDGEVV